MENLNEQGLVRALASGAHLLYVVTENERYTEGIVVKAAARVNGAGAVCVWTCTDGFLCGDALVPETQDALAALDFALAQPGPALFLMKDLAAFWHDNPFVVRKLKTFAASGGAFAKPQARGARVLLGSPSEFRHPRTAKFGGGCGFDR